MDDSSVLAVKALPSPDERRRQRRMRVSFRPLFRLIVRAIARVRVQGLERIPERGPAVLAFNHLGHLDFFLFYLTLPEPPEVIGAADLLDVRLAGWAFRQYGAIPVHRGEFDRAVLDQALALLGAGLRVALAPEARQSLTGQLEQARTGVAYLAMKAGVPVVPVAITGTKFAGRRLVKTRRRLDLSITYGDALTLPPLPRGGPERKAALREQSDRIMLAIAAMLPEDYRGVYGGVER